MEKRNTSIGFTGWLAVLLIIEVIFIMGLFLFSLFHNAPRWLQAEVFFPEPTNYIVDSALVLTTEQIDSINRLLKDYDNEKHQIAVAVVKSTSPLTIEEYGIKLAEKWKVGHVSDDNVKSDNGAIIILAVQDRKVRIEVGYGLESKINDAKAGRIIDEYMIPSLKNEDWNNAILGGIEGLAHNMK